MKTLQLGICRIGNSRGIRIPARLLKKYGLVDIVVIEEKPDELVLGAAGGGKLSWEQTLKEMAASKENWDDFDSTVTDGLDAI